MIRLITKTFTEKAEKARERAARVLTAKASGIGTSVAADESSTFRPSSMVIIYDNSSFLISKRIKVNLS